MANEKNDISDIVKKCKILLLDIEGTTTSISFVKDKLFPYAEENVKEFLNAQWGSEDVKESVTALRKLALEDQEKSVDGVVTIPGEDASKDDQIEGLVNSVKWQMSVDRKVGALKQLQGLIWKQGYDNGDIKGHVYDDVSPALDLWRSVEDQKVYIYSSGAVQAQKLLFGQSQAGDLLKYINGHFDTAVGAKQEAASYAAIVDKIGCKPDEILFLTDIVKEAEAARASGLNVALVSREGNAPLPDAIDFPVIYSLAQLALTNKRKPDAQDVQPAKVLKTDVDADVKTNVETENATKSVTGQVLDESEKMDVEEEVIVKDASTDKTMIKEVTDVNEVIDTPVCDVEPIIEESVDKTEQKETEMEAESVEETDSKPKDDTKVENGNDKPSAIEETPTVITEIEEVSNGKEDLDAAEVIEDLEPVIEEPPTISDIEELKNVGEVLEKECDEILCKVQDVTNLDNIPLKPMLNTIVEEAMETENTDSNDIVDKILDSELELEMKGCDNIDKNTAKEITDAKTDQPVSSVDKPVVIKQSAKENGGEMTEEQRENNDVESSSKKLKSEPIPVSDVVEAATRDECSIRKDEHTVEVAKTDGEEEKSKITDIQENNVVNKSVENKTELTKNNTEEAQEVDAIETTLKETENSQGTHANDIAKEKNDTEIKVTAVSDKEKTIETQESKLETKESTVENKESGIEKEEAKIDAEENKTDSIGSKVDIETNKIDSEKNKVVIEESKVKTDSKLTELTEGTVDSGSRILKVEKTKTDKIDEPQECPMETEKPEVETKTATVSENTLQTETVKVQGTEAETVDLKELPTEISKMETDTIQEKESQSGQTTMETETVETKETIIPENNKAVTTETQVNGKTTNGDTEMVNGKEEELNARLSMENGKETVNGANGDTAETDKAKSESSVDTELQDIKVKTVATDEPRNEPIEQLMEA